MISIIQINRDPSVLFCSWWNQFADELRGREKYWGKKSRPTHFLCLRVSDPDVLRHVTIAHALIRAVDPDYQDCLIPPERLHVTLACLGLDTPEQVSCLHLDSL